MTHLRRLLLLSLVIVVASAQAETNPLQWSLATLSARSYTAGPLTSQGVLGQSAGLTRYALQFRSDGLAEYGFADVPDGPGPFPVIVMVHGHVNPSAYHTLDYTTRYADALARAGFLVLHPDLRGYGRSQGTEPLFYAGYTVDVLNLIGSVEQYAGQGVLTKAQRGPVGLWGHSLGGNVVLRAAVVKPEWVSAVLMYGGMSGDVRENALQEVNVYHDPVGRQVLQLPISVTESVSTPGYEARLKAAFSIHWGTSDRDVPPAWSDALCLRLRKLGKTHDCFSYVGAPHLFPAGSDWNTALLMRTTAFFQKVLAQPLQ